MQQNNKQDQILEDEIDLRELFVTLWNKRVFVIAFTVLVMICSIVYVTIKNPPPIYKGSLLVEIGEIKTERSLAPIDNPKNLKYILEAEVEAEAEVEVEVSIPSGTNNLIEITTKAIDKEKIKEKINFMYQKLIERQSTKLKMYKNYIPTKKIGLIIIANTAINEPKTKQTVAVAFITGFILSIVLVFLMQFIQNIKQNTNKEEGYK